VRLKVIRFQIRLDEISFRALQDLATEEYRDLRYQAALLIRESLEHRGLLSTAEQDNLSSQPTQQEGTSVDIH
jgi:hypothetical protein